MANRLSFHKVAAAFLKHLLPHAIFIPSELVLIAECHFRDSMTTLSEFSRYTETAENDQRLEIDHIQGYVMGELKRQNNIANETKFLCEKKLVELQNVLEDVRLLSV